MQKYFILTILVVLTHACIPASSKNTPVPTELPSPVFTSPPNLCATPKVLLTTDTPLPSPSPTLLPSATPSPISLPPLAITNSPIEIITVDPKPTTQLGDIPIPGKIYVWSKPFYGYLDPNQRGQELITQVETQPPQEQAPGKAITVAFSHYTQQIAYLLKTENKKLSLRITDLEFQNPTSVWEDNENIAENSSVDDLLSIRWGPGDKFILFRNRPVTGPNEGKYFFFVYSIENNSVTSLVGSCEQLFISPTSGEFAIGCPISETDFWVLEQDGSQWTLNALPENSIFIKDWVFSRDGSKILYANGQDEILLVNKAMVALQLSMTYPGLGNLRILQMSQDGSKLLIYGNNIQLCPFSESIGRTPPCWQVVDSLTGEVIWSSSLISGYDATLSPDGQWVVMFHSDATVFPIARWGAVYSISDNSAAIIYNFIVGAVSWGE